MDSNIGVLLNNKYTFDLQFQSRESALDAILCDKGTSLVYNSVFHKCFLKYLENIARVGSHICA